MTVAFSVGVAVCAVGVVMAAPDSDREVLVQVELSTLTGQPLPAVGMEMRACSDGGTEMFNGVTDASGQCTIAASLCDGHELVFVKPWVPRANGFENAQEMYVAARASTRAWAFDIVYPVAVPAEGDASIEVTLPPAIAVSGRMVDATGEPIRAVVGRVGGLLAALAEADGAFVLEGVPQGVDSWFFAALETAPWLKLWRVSGDQLDIALDMGDQPTAIPSGVCTLTFTATNWDSDSRPDMLPTGPLIVRDDLAVVAQAYISKSGEVFFGYRGDERELEVSAGTYYVLPASARWSPELRAVLSAIADGDVRCASLRSVVLAAGDAVAVDVDIEAELAAMRAVFGGP